MLYLRDGVTCAVLNLTRMLPILLVFNWATLVLSRITQHLLIVAKTVRECILISGLMVLLVEITLIDAWMAASATHRH